MLPAEARWPRRRDIGAWEERVAEMAGVERSFGVQLRRFREAVGLSQEELAERAGLTASAIGALERGERRRPYPHTVKLLSAALELDEPGRAALVAAVPRRSTGAPTSAYTPALEARDEVAASLRGLPLSTGNPAVTDAPSSSSNLASNLARASTPFVGRQGELTVLRAKLADAFTGHGSVVMLVGEAGIGKTRLAREFAENASSEGAVVLGGCCFEGDWQPPYGPWVEALGPYVRSRPAQEVRQELGPGAASIAQLVPEIRTALPDVPLPTPLSPDEERFRLYDSIIRFLLAISGKQLLLLVLDDLHWADPDSLRLLRHLARSVARARVLILGAYRDPEFGLSDGHPLIGTLSMLRRESDYERIAVRGFTRDEVAEYLAESAGRPLPQALVRVIEEETSGNPFYAREVLRHLTEEAKLLQRDGRWTTDLSIRELGIPEGVRQVVGRRVARLSEQTGVLLRLASGFTGGFGFDVLQTLSDLPEQVLLDCVDEALEAGIIRTSGGTPPRYEFAHAIVRHTLYESLNPDRRARLHRRIALALEWLQASGKLEDAAELATQYHASAAVSGAARGIPHALTAAEQARAAYAHERAATFLRMARDLAAENPPVERADILRQLAIAEAEAVMLERAQRSVEEALEAMSATGVEPRARAEFLAVVARALKDGGADMAAWEPLVERGLALVGDRRDLLWARLTLLRNHFEVIESGPIGGSRWLGHDPEAVAIARTEGDEEDYARTLDPLEPRTRQETEGVLALTRSWSRPIAVMWALEVVGRDLLYRHGAFREGLAVYQELLAVSERFGSIPAQAEALAHIPTSLIATGDLPLAQQAIQQANELVARLGSGHRMHNWVAISRAGIIAYFLGGDWGQFAEEVGEYAASVAARRSSIGMVAAGYAAFSANRAGNAAGARALLQHVTPVLERMPATNYAHSHAVALAGIAVWELEAVEYAATYRRLTVDLLEAGVGSTVLGPLELWVARMSTLRGDFDEAQAYFEQARSRLDAPGADHLRGIVDYDQACALIRAGVTDSTRIARLLDAASHTFRSHGMLGWAGLAAERKEALMTARRSGSSADRQHPAGLTGREAEVLRLVAAGLTNKEIAAKLVLSVPTAERHVANIYAKIGVGRRSEAVAFAVNNGLGPDRLRQVPGISPQAPH
jgi:DNA-binding CsgD family transcriptional regulator/transcriptional regulator with XRE-family HTH domain